MSPNVSATPPTSRPVRQSRSSLRPSTSGSASQGHALGTGSASGAGLWLAGSRHDSGAEQLESWETGAGARLPPPGPAYHFSASVAANHRASAELLHGGPQVKEPLAATTSSSDLGYLSTSEPMDLDLSFDFVSQLEGLSAREKRRVPETHTSSSSVMPSPASSRAAPPPRPSNPTPSRSAMPTVPPPPDFELRRTTSNTSTGASPRGMSTTKWSSRRKLPPPPLPLSGPSPSGGRKKKGSVASIAAAALEPVSYFSPMTATSAGPKDIFSPASEPDEDDLAVEEPLAVTPLSATRRGEQSGLSTSDSTKNVGGRRRSSSSVSRRSLGPPSLPPTEPLPALPKSAPPLPVLQPRTIQDVMGNNVRPGLTRSTSTSGDKPTAHAIEDEDQEEQNAAMSDSSVSDRDDDDVEHQPRLRRTGRRTLASQNHPPSSFLHRQSWSTGMSHGGASTNASHGASTGASHGASNEGSTNSSNAVLGHRSKGDSLASAESFRTAVTGSTHHQSSVYHSGPSVPTSSNDHGQRQGGTSIEPVPPVPAMASGPASSLLFQPLSAPAPAPAGLAPLAVTFSSPQMGSYKSTPETPFSPLFSEMGTAITGDTSPGPGNTPSTKFAKLQAETRRHSGDGMEGSVIAIVDAGKSVEARHSSSPPGQRQTGVARHVFTYEPIAEEKTSGMPERLPSGLPRSETAQWIRSQSKAHSLGASTETDDSSPFQTMQPMVVSTASSCEGHEGLFTPPLSQDVEQPTRRGDVEARWANAAAATVGRPRASSTGPWPQSPLLLSSNLATEVDSRDVSAELKSMVPEAPAPAPSGLGRDLGPGVTFEDEMVRRNTVGKGKAAERIEAMVPGSVSYSESSSANGSGNSVIIHDSEQSSLVDLDLEFDIVGLSGSQGTESVRPTAPAPAHTKSLTPTGSISSTIEGFACNVTPPVHNLELPQLPSATAQPQTKVQIQQPAQRPDSSIVVNRLTIRDPLRLERNSALSIVAVDVEDDSVEGNDPTSSKLGGRHSTQRSSAGMSWKPFANTRWGQKLFAQNNGGATAGGLAGNRSGAKRTKTKSLDLVEMQKALASPPMRSLTLVNRREEQPGHARRDSRAEQAAAMTLRSGPLAGAEATSVSAPASATFPPALSATDPTVPRAAAVHSTATSKRIKRRSRLGYLADGQETHVDMGDDVPSSSQPPPQASSSRSPDLQLRAFLDDMKSPRVGPSPSGWTPQLAFGPGGMPLWGQLPPTSPQLDERMPQTAIASDSAGRYPAQVRTDPESPWLGFEEAEADLQASRDRLRLLASQTMPGATLPHQYITKLEEEAALRRRSTLLARSAHRPSASVPPTATILPDGNRHKRSSRVLLHGPDVSGTVLHVEDDEQADDARLGRPAGRPMSIFVPTSAIEAHLLRSAGVATGTDAAGSSKALGSDLPSFFTSPAKALDSAAPSVSLFWAGFLGMPWLWLIGGWGLGEDGRIASKSRQEGGDGKVAFWEHQESMKQARLHDLRQSGMRNLSPSSVRGIKSPATGHDDSSVWDATMPGESSRHGAEASNGSSGYGRGQGDMTSTTRYESARDVSVSMRKMEGQATLGSRITEGGTRHAMPHANRIPSARSRSLASALSINPEVCVAKSPVRTSEGLLLDETQDHAVSIEQLAAESKASAPGHPRRRGSSPIFSGLNEEERRSQALLELDDRHRSVVLAAGPSTDHLAPWHPFRRWSRLEPYVLYNRIAAIVGGLLVAAGWSVALGVLVSHF